MSSSLPAPIPLPRRARGQGLRVAPTVEATPADMEALSLRQWRHHNANAWHRILCDVWVMAEETGNLEAIRLATRVERRIKASMMASDALFGITRHPGSMRDRLLRLGRALLQGLAMPQQNITLDIMVAPRCPRAPREALLRVAREMMANAIRHGLHARIDGRIGVSLRMVGEALRLEVTDDGWGPSPRDRAGEGLGLMQELAASHGGRFGLERREGLTVAWFELPHGR